MVRALCWIKSGRACVQRKCSKKPAFVFLTTIFVFLTIWIILITDDTHSSSYQVFQQSTRQEKADEIIRPRLHENGVDDPRNPMFYNIIPEEEALAFQPCQDIYETASTQHSKISLADRSKHIYTIGETIHAVVTVHDSYGTRKYTGGDQLRATIENEIASAPCMVTDNRNGTHAVSCEALWVGDSIIIVKLAYTRETITSIYRVRNKVLANRQLSGVYLRGRYTDETPCHPNNTLLTMLSVYTKLCNMTSFNTGMPFYCGKPNNEQLTCQDLHCVKMKDKCENLPITDCEKELFARGQVILNQTLTVIVANSSGHTGMSVVENPSIPCSQYNVSLTWSSRRPTGYLYGEKWNLLNCKGVQLEHFKSCFKNRRLYLFGDSTMRQWYEAILELFKCKLTTQDFQLCKKCKESSHCVNKEINFRVGWYFHSEPIFVGRDWGTEYKWRSISDRIDNIPRNEHAVLVIHVYAHHINFHHNVFMQKLEIIRKSVDNFLSRNRYSVVLIKAPHTFEGPAGECRLHDYYGYVYSKILYDVFDGLHDRVILLNNRDATLAEQNKDIHPPNYIVHAMIGQMMSYMCD